MSKEDFYKLTPDEVMNAISGAGYEPTGEFQQLNSYENRVFDVRLENKMSVVVKFYRPGRWSKDAILEEHDFLDDVFRHGITAVPPHKLKSGSTLDFYNGMYFAVFPKIRARVVDELNPDQFKRIGRLLGQLHNVGAQKKSRHRPTMNAEEYGEKNILVLKNCIAPEVRSRYLDAAEIIVDYLKHNLDASQFIRIHGDCHRGNILRTDEKDGSSQFFFVDFDDFCMGHPVQDFWMLLSAPENTDEALVELDGLLEGYLEMRSFDEKLVELIPALRGLRILHYGAWIAKRWEDPSFPRLFPQFRDFNYWANEAEALESIANRL